MKHASVVGFALLLFACDGAASEDPPPSRNRERNADDQKPLSFFVGSVSECTASYQRAGLCKPSPLTRCILVENRAGEDLTCKVVAKAALNAVEENFTRLYTSANQFNVTAEAGKDVTCFDFNALDRTPFTFERFTSFSGSCQKKADSQPPRWECDPERAACTELGYDQATCLPGWPCLKIRIDTKSLRMTTCTPDLARRNLCAVNDPDVFVCVTTSNEGPAALRCDFRLNAEIKRAYGVQAMSSVLRGSLFFAGDRAETCFPFRGVSDPGAVQLRKTPMNAVCRQKDASEDLRRICDLDNDECATESSVLDVVR